MLAFSPGNNLPTEPPRATSSCCGNQAIIGKLWVSCRNIRWSNNPRCLGKNPIYYTGKDPKFSLALRLISKNVSSFGHHMGCHNGMLKRFHCPHQPPSVPSCRWPILTYVQVWISIIQYPTRINALVIPIDLYHH